MIHTPSTFWTHSQLSTTIHLPFLKTYLVSAAFHELAKKGVKSAIVFWPDMLSELKNSFSSGNFGEKIDFLKKVPLLLIDDI